MHAEKGGKPEIFGDTSKLFGIVFGSNLRSSEFIGGYRSKVVHYALYLKFW